MWTKFPVASKVITVKMGIIHYYKSTFRPELSQLPFFMLKQHHNSRNYTCCKRKRND